VNIVETSLHLFVRFVIRFIAEVVSPSYEYRVGRWPTKDCTTQMAA
jgi:hypothetical protein